jgi:hypothetical protein
MDLQALRAARRDAPFETIIDAPEWRPFVTFLARFFDLRLTETPGVIAALDAVEAEHELRLWPLVREWYRLVGARRELTFMGGSELELVPPDQLEPGDDDLPLFQDSTANFWVVRLSDLDVLDPPVTRVVENPGEADFTEPWSDSLARLLRSTALWTLILGAAEEVHDVRPIRGARLLPMSSGGERLAAAYPKLDWASGCMSPSDEVRGDDDTVLLVADTQWWGITRDEAALRRLRAIVPGASPA